MFITLKPSRPPIIPDAPPALGHACAVLWEDHAHEYYWNGDGALSIKLFFKDRALYRTGGGLHAVDANSYLLLNQSQPYELVIESDRGIESFCLFFEDGFAADVLRSLTARADTLLDDPLPTAAPLHLFERLYPHDALLSPALFQLHEAVRCGYRDPDGLKEAMHGIMECLLRVHARTLREVDTLDSVRAATREELYRRLYLARDTALASLHTPVTLEDMARTACLSPNHFLRTFKQLFRQTPHQFLMAQRLERAAELLAHTNRPVTDIAVDVGFESLGSFSWLFRKRCGLSPQAYRRAAGKGDFEEAPPSRLGYAE
jgi:AraC family transcriptional regulator